MHLPPGYKSQQNQRYPVICLLHGFTNSDENCFGLKPHLVNVPQVADQPMTSGAPKIMIIVMLNAYTALEGSFYGKSVTTGDWEDFVDSELVEYIDSHYRTVANRGSRGLAGHSMGGYGTGRLGMRRPDVYSSFYALRARYLDSGLGIRPTAEQVRAAPFGAKAQFALAAAFSPDPGNAPLFLDLPLKDGAPQPSVVAPCAANSPRNARPITPQPAATQGNCL